MHNKLIEKLLSHNNLQALDVDVFPAGMKILVLAPHPDDFDAVGVTLRRFKANGNLLTLAVISSGASGVEDSYLKNDGNLKIKTLIREREQLESALFCNLNENKIIFLRTEEEENGNILENDTNFLLIKNCLAKANPDIVFMPHWNDTNASHRRSYALAKKAMLQIPGQRILFLNKDPKTVTMPIKLYSAFDESEASWKGKLLRHHMSQHERNLHTRGYGFDCRILEFNRLCAVEIKREEYAEVFDIEVVPRQHT